MPLAPSHRAPHHSPSRYHTTAFTGKKEMELLCFLLSSNRNPLKSRRKAHACSRCIIILVSILLWVAERLEKAALVRPANHSRLSCMLAKAFRSLTSRRISCWGMSLSPRLPMRTSDSLPKAALKCKNEASLRNRAQGQQGGDGEGQTTQSRTAPGQDLEPVVSWSFESLIKVNKICCSSRHDYLRDFFFVSFSLHLQSRHFISFPQLQT